MTFLEIVQQAAFLSGVCGTTSTSQPTTTVGQTGNRAKMVSLVNVAWRKIQTDRPDWGWMRALYTGPTVAAQRYYTGVTSFSLTNFSSWIYNPDAGDDSGVTAYLTATGVSDEQPIQYRSWEFFKQNFLRGTQTNARPQFFTIDPQNRMALHPIPDAIYTISGEYNKAATALSGDSDTPGLPAENHWLIVWEALVLLAVDEESSVQYPEWKGRATAERAKLEQIMLPPIRAVVPIA